MAVFAGINFLFYRQPVLMVLWVPFVWFWTRWRKQKAAEKRRKELYFHFRDLMAAMQFSVCAGYSLENALREACQDLKRTYGSGDVMVTELKEMCSQLSLSVPAEHLFLDLAERSALEDIRMFANVLVISKRTGGNMETVLKNTWRIISEKIDTEREIAGSIAARKYEQTIMNFIPLGIILYIQLSFPGFTEVLYGNPAGIAVMSLCLAVYGAAWWLGGRITKTEV